MEKNYNCLKYYKILSNTQYMHFFFQTEKLFLELQREE